MNDLTKKMDDFGKKFDLIFMQISKTCNSLLHKRIIDLKPSFLDNVQYFRRDIIEISPVPPEVSNEELEGLVCKALSYRQEMEFLPMILNQVTSQEK